MVPGVQVGNYVVVRQLGSGGMGAVWLVRHAALRSLHALKVLHEAGPDVDRRLVEEGRVQSMLDHPNVVRVTDAVMIGDRAGLIMEFVDGPTLAAWLDGRPPLSVAEIDALARGILLGVASAHARGWVHRDIKPGNVLLKSADVGLIPKVCDFGMARALDGEADGFTNTTTSRRGVGTRRYMSLDQLLGKQPDPRFDVFSLGALLYEICMGRPMFPTLESWQDAIRSGRYPRLERPDLPERMRLSIEAAFSNDCPKDAAALYAGWTGGEAERVFRAATLRATRPGAVHVDADRLLATDLNDDEEAHLRGCVRCRLEMEVARAAENDVDTLSSLVPPARIVAQCRRELRNFPDAEIEEIAQDVFVEAWNKLGQYRGDGRFLSFLIGIAVRKCSHARRRKRDLLTEDGVLEGTSNEDSPLQGLTDDERDGLVAEAVAAVLNEHEQRVANLRWVMDYPREDVARLLGLADANEVRVILQRCQRRLEAEIRRRVAEHGHGSSFLR